MSSLADLLSATGEFLTICTGSPRRKQVFSLGFITVCTITAIIELAVLAAAFGGGTSN